MEEYYKVKNQRTRGVLLGELEKEARRRQVYTLEKNTVRRRYIEKEDKRWSAWQMSTKKRTSKRPKQKRARLFH